MPEQSPKPRWSARRKAWTLFVLGNVVCVGYGLWMAFAPPPGMPISVETTRFLGPLDEESGLDTRGAIRKAKGWPVEKTPHEWDRLLDSESDHPVKYQDPYTIPQQGQDERHTRRRQRLGRPFNENDDPEYSELITANEPWYRAILDSEPKPDSFFWADLPSFPSDQFRLRAMLAFGRGDTERGVESLRFLARLAENQRRWTTGFGILNSVRFDRECWQAIPAILFSLEEPPRELCEFAFEFSKPTPLPQAAARVIDEGDRYFELVILSTPTLYTGAVNQNSSFSMNKPPTLSSEGIRLNWFMHRVDWYRFASVYHEFVDGFVQRIGIDNDARRTKAIADYRAEYQQRFATPPDLRNWQAVILGDVTRVVERKMVDSFYRIEDTINWDRRGRRQVGLAVYLARFRLEHRHFPKSLKELEPLTPKEHRFFLFHNVTGELWHYECLDEGTGFVLKEPNQRWVEMQWLPDN